MDCSFVVICWEQTTPHKQSICFVNHFLFIIDDSVCYNMLWPAVTTVWHPVWIWPPFPYVFYNTDGHNFPHILDVTAEGFFAL